MPEVETTIHLLHLPHRLLCKRHKESVGVFPALIYRHLADSSKSSLRLRNYSRRWEANDLASFFSPLGPWLKPAATKSKQAAHSDAPKPVWLGDVRWDRAEIRAWSTSLVFICPFHLAPFCCRDLQRLSPPGWLQPPAWAEDIPSCPGPTLRIAPRRFSPEIPRQDTSNIYFQDTQKQGLNRLRGFIHLPARSPRQCPLFYSPWI